MLLKQTLSLYRFVKITWKIDILMLLLCVVAYFIDTKLMSDMHILQLLFLLHSTITRHIAGGGKPGSFGVGSLMTLAPGDETSWLIPMTLIIREE